MEVCQNEGSIKGPSGGEFDCSGKFVREIRGSVHQSESLTRLLSEILQRWQRLKVSEGEGL
jgi:hypothetical protein